MVICKQCSRLYYQTYSQMSCPHCKAHAAQLRCNVCNKYLDSDESINRHYDKHHKDSSIPETVLETLVVLEIASHIIDTSIFDLGGDSFSAGGGDSGGGGADDSW